MFKVKKLTIVIDTVTYSIEKQIDIVEIPLKVLTDTVPFPCNEKKEFLKRLQKDYGKLQGFVYAKINKDLVPIGYQFKRITGGVYSGDSRQNINIIFPIIEDENKEFNIDLNTGFKVDPIKIKNYKNIYAKVLY